MHFDPFVLCREGFLMFFFIVNQTYMKKGDNYLVDKQGFAPLPPFK